jgi:hypothetical protein
MSLVIPPIPRYMIVCDEVLTDNSRPGKLLIVGLTTLVAWPSGTKAPLHLEKLVVLLILTDGRGNGMCRILCLDDESKLPVFGSSAKPISFEGQTPIGHYGVTFNLVDCRFPRVGVYIVQFLFDDLVVCEQLITVR